MNKKFESLIILCILLMVTIIFSTWYLIRSALLSGTSSEMTTASHHVNVTEALSSEIRLPFHRENALFDGDVSFVMHSNHALLINLTTNEVMFEHGAKTRIYPASLTKIMTVLIGVEQIESQRMIVRADFERLMLANASIVGFEYGEERTTMEILHGAMLSSGADATATIAYHVAGSYEAFVGLMNEKASAIGMRDTNFTNASGLHDNNHYTTAYDMALLLRYALDDPVFREIFTARSYPFTTLFGEERIMHSTLFINMWTTAFVGGEMMGGRTGFTSEAGRCLASLATNGVDEFILITLGADENVADGIAHIVDAFTIYEYFLRNGD